MAKHKSIDLKITILSKIMLLEYFRPEHFTSLSEFNTGIDDMKSKFEAFEKEFIENSDNSKEVSDKDFESWLNDPWLNNWLRLEPTIGSEDLIPYFSFRVII